MQAMKRLLRKYHWRHLTEKSEGPLFWLRQASWMLRQPPEVLVIGAQKGGTTSLYHYLQLHPQVFGSRYGKEVHFFDTWGDQHHRDNYHLGLAWYLAHFDVLPKNELKLLNMEGTPSYLFDPLAPQRIRESLPRVKMIAILRDPVRRAISHYQMVKRKGHEPLALLPAMQAEEERLAAYQNARGKGEQEPFRHSYKARGRYAEQIERYWALLPRENLLLLRSEDLLADPQWVMRQVYGFIGVEPGFTLPEKITLNANSQPEAADPEALAYLREYFAPHNNRLAELTGLDVSRWGQY